MSTSAAQGLFALLYIALFIVVLVLNFLFFGCFFVNFVFDQVTGEALIQF